MNSALSELRLPIQESGILCFNCVQHNCVNKQSSHQERNRVAGGVTVWALLVQIVDREQELMSTAGLQSLGGGAGLGRGGLDRELRIVPSKPGLGL